MNIKDAKKRGLRVYRQVTYFATTDDGMTYQLPAEAHYEYLYQWRKYPKKKPPQPRNRSE